MSRSVYTPNGSKSLLHENDLYRVGDDGALAQRFRQLVERLETELGLFDNAKNQK